MRCVGDAQLAKCTGALLSEPPDNQRSGAYMLLKRCATQARRLHPEQLNGWHGSLADCTG